MGFNFSSPSLASLEPLLAQDSDAQSLLADIPTSQWALNRVNGALYALPVSTRPLVMYYNKTLLDSLGLQPPASGWTLDDFWALANAVASRASVNTAGSSKIYGFVPLNGMGFVNYLLTAQGVQLYDFSATPPIINFNRPEVLNIVSKLAGEAAQGAIPAINDPADYRKGNAGERLNLIQQGQAALWMDQAGGNSSLFPPDQSPKFEIGMAPLPATGRPLEPDQSGVSLFISKKAQNPEACWEWMKFLSIHPEAFLGIPVRSSALDSPEFKALAGGDTAAIYQQVLAQPHQDPYPDLVEKFSSSPLYIWWPDTLASVFEGVSPAQALTELQGKAQTYLQCISTAPDPNQEETWVGCAKQADPGFILPNIN
jgi:ABC-type glycerol-3-phosphate transport system substrate-binding protein